MATIMDESLEDDEEIVFQAGTHEQSIRMKMADYKTLAEPRILAFSYRMT